MKLRTVLGQVPGAADVKVEQITGLSVMTIRLLSVLYAWMETATRTPKETQSP